ncbi:MAG: sporulation protein YtfJ [Clostridia bacterium]|nr:sporulation protein YtfJ [Clostridia bacterium]
MDKSVQGVLGISMDKIKEMVDVDTVIGTPIVADNVTLIPISRVTYGFAGGGSDLPTKDPDRFGGGSGAGITITPIAIISINQGKVQVLPISDKPGPVESAIASVPSVVDTVSDLINKHKGKKTKSIEA